MLLAYLDRIRDKRRRQIWTPAQATGRRGEDLAHRYLRRLGYIVVARNYRLSAGDAEADIIAWDGDTLVIVEVKTRESEAFGSPDRAIDEDKERALRRVGREYARKTNTPEARLRYDFVNVLLGPPVRIELLVNALSQDFTQRR